MFVRPDLREDRADEGLGGRAVVGRGADLVVVLQRGRGLVRLGDGRVDLRLHRPRPRRRGGVAWPVAAPICVICPYASSRQVAASNKSTGTPSLVSCSTIWSESSDDDDQVRVVLRDRLRVGLVAGQRAVFGIVAGKSDWSSTATTWRRRPRVQVLGRRRGQRDDPLRRRGDLHRAVLGGHRHRERGGGRARRRRGRRGPAGGRRGRGGMRRGTPGRQQGGRGEGGGWISARTDGYARCLQLLRLTAARTAPEGHWPWRAQPDRPGPRGPNLGVRREATWLVARSAGRGGPGHSQLRDSAGLAPASLHDGRAAAAATEDVSKSPGGRPLCGRPRPASARSWCAWPYSL